MSRTRITTNVQEQNQTITNYYKFQSRIYDLTRWSFLFGRKQIVKALPFYRDKPFTLLEVGCGTGSNLRRLARYYPNAQLIGMDLSVDMLKIAKRNTLQYKDRVTLVKAPYGQASLSYRPDVILFSYALTMINPQWHQLLVQAHLDLNEGGIIAVTDFHHSNLRSFKDHMSHHHVRMDRHLLPALESQFSPIVAEVKKAYFGVWEYMLFVGKKAGG